MGGSDDASALRQLLVKRHPRLLHRVDVGKAMQIQQRRPDAALQKPNFASVNFDSTTAHGVLPPNYPTHQKTVKKNEYYCSEGRCQILCFRSGFPQCTTGADSSKFTPGYSRVN